LAVLPGGVGACDWAMGCGIRANKKEDKKGVIKSLLAKFNKNRPKNNELSHGEIRERLRSTVMESLPKSPNQWVWIREAFNDRFIYEFEDQSGKTTLFQQSYMVDSNDNIVLDGEPMEVEVETKFVPVQNSSSNDSPDEDLDNDEADSLEKNTKKEGDNVTKEEKVIVLIKNEKTEFGDADKDSLMKMSESTLDLMIKNDCQCNNDNDDGAQGSDPAPKAKAPEAKAPEANANDGVYMTPEQIAEMVDKKLAEHTAKGEKDSHVKVLKDNGIELTKEEISSLSVNTLEAMAKKSVPQNNHRGLTHVPSGGLNGNSDEEDETPEMPDFINHCQEESGAKLTPTLTS